MKVSVSILSSSIKPQDIVKKLDESKADYIHLDIMDGKFVENKTWTYSEVKKIISYVAAYPYRKLYINRHTFY